MFRAVAVAALAVCCVSAGDIPKEVLQLARLKARVQQAMKTLPDYTCLAVTERSRQALRAPAPHQVDTVRMEVAHSEGHDLYAWPGAAKFTASDPTRMIASGMFGSGEFADHLTGIFHGNGIIRYSGVEGLLGKQLLRWDFTLTQAIAADWRFTYAGRTVSAGEKGSFWADPETLDVVRVQVESDDLPPDFPIRDAITTITYARVQLGSRDVFLAQTALTVLTDFTGERSFNFTEFSHCRQYVTRSDIKYGVTAPASEDPVAAAGVREIVIPADLLMTVKLSRAIESVGAAVGDPIEAEVIADVMRKKSVVVPAGAVLRGRLRRMEPDEDRFLIGLEFTDLEYPGYHARFFGKLVRAEDWKMRTSDVPGVGFLLAAEAGFRLPRGLSMVWATQDVSKK